MEKQPVSSSLITSLTRRRFLTTVAPLGLGSTALLGISSLTASAATNTAWHKNSMLASGGISSPVLVPSQDGRLELFTVGADGNLYHIWQYNDLTWSNWYSHGQPGIRLLADFNFPHYICLTQTPSGLVELFALGGTRQTSYLYTIGQVIPSGYWTAWSYLGTTPASVINGNGAIGPLVTAIDGNGNLQVFQALEVPYGNGFIVQGTRASNGNWSGWTTLPTPSGTSLTSSVATAVNPDGRLELFAIGQDGNLWHTWQTSVGGSWATWYSHGNPGTTFAHTSEITLAANADGRLDLFIVGQNAVLYHLPQLILNANWGSWTSLGQPPTTNFYNGYTIAIGWSADGRRELFTVGSDSNLWHIWQTDLNGNWSDWYSHGSPSNPSISGPILDGGVAIHINNNNLGELFANGVDGNMYSLTQGVVNGAWNTTWINYGQP